MIIPIKRLDVNEQIRLKIKTMIELEYEMKKKKSCLTLYT